MFAKLIARILARLIGGAFVFIGTLGLMVVKDVFSNHLILIGLSIVCLITGGLIAWCGFRK